MNLLNVTRAIVTETGAVSDKDIEETVIYLMAAIDNVRVFRRIMKKLNADLAYENES